MDFQKARPWLDLLDNILTLLGNHSSTDIFAPSIAVFGDQSSGKSSLLQSISGISFPSISGLTCPTHISMVKIDEDDLTSSNPSWSAEVKLHNMNSSEFGGICLSTEDLSSRFLKAASVLKSRSANGFSREPIHVTIRSTTVLQDLSIIDLPGIIRTTTSGQHKSLIQDVDRLIEHYLRLPETVILAVIPANQDIATVDILERASLYDPHGVRTVGVLTKPDLVDDGGEEEVIRIVQNLRKKLHLGYVLVKNRSQASVAKTSMSLKEALDAEHEYFSSHREWSRVDEKCRGTRALCDKLTEIIITRAQEGAPALKRQLEAQMKTIDDKVKALGAEVVFHDEFEMHRLLNNLVNRFAQTLRHNSMGEYRDSSTLNDVDLRINYQISQTLQQMNEALHGTVPDVDSEEFSQRLFQCIAEMRGRELPGLGSTRLLLSTVSVELDQWRQAVEDCVAQCFETYADSAARLAYKLFSQFPRLCDRVVSIVNEECRRQQVEVSTRVEEMFLRDSGTNSYGDKELVDSINQMRVGRFEQALRVVLKGASDGSHDGKDGKILTEGGVTKDELKQHVLKLLGPVYMTYHSIPSYQSYSSSSSSSYSSQNSSSSFSSSINGLSSSSSYSCRSRSMLQNQLEDGRAALKAHWKLCEGRINDDVASIIDMQLLQRCSKQVEQRLQSEAQLWLCSDNAEEIRELFAEDVLVTKERDTLAASRGMIEDAIKAMTEILLVQ